MHLKFLALPFSKCLILSPIFTLNYTIMNKEQSLKHLQTGNEHYRQVAIVVVFIALPTINNNVLCTSLLSLLLSVRSSLGRNNHISDDLKRA